jgi:hypothetical protein
LGTRLVVFKEQTARRLFGRLGHKRLICTLSVN